MRALILLLCTLAFGNSPAELRATFQTGNQAFEKGDYDAAIHGYEQLLQAGVDTSEVHYNLGNAYYRQQKFGQSIFHFRKAATLAPRDADTVFNLQFSRQKATDQIERSGMVLWKHWLLIEGLSPRGLFILLLMISALATIAFTLHLYRRGEALGYAKWALLVGATYLTFAAGFRTFGELDYGVVKVPEAKVMSSFGKDGVMLFRLHEGAEFDIEDRVGSDWLRITLQDGKRGWISADAAVF